MTFYIIAPCNAHNFFASFYLQKKKKTERRVLHFKITNYFSSLIKITNYFSSYLHCVLHTGSFGKIFRGKYNPNPEENTEESVDVAVKTIKSKLESAKVLEIIMYQSAWFPSIHLIHEFKRLPQ